MKHVKKILLTILLVPLLGSYMSQAQNLIQNGSFENDLDSWWTNAESGAEASFTIVTDDVAEGSKALKVDVTTPGPNAWNVQAVNNAWASEAGKEYTLKFMAKAASSGSSFKAILQLDPSYAEQVIYLTDSWQEYEWTFTAGANNLELKLHFPNAGTFFIDDINIPSEEEEMVELIQNGNFESGTGDSFTNWWFGSGDGAATFTEETTDVQEGSRSLKVEVTALGTNPWDIQGINDAWASVQGEDYTLTFWAKSQTAGGTLKTVMQIGDSYAEQSFTFSENWEKYEWAFTAGANNLELKFQFTSTGIILLDNVSVPAAPAEQEMVELVLNGGFENGTGDSFTNWWYSAGDGTAVFSEETTDVHEGDRAFNVEVTALGSNPWEIQAVNDAWASKLGEEYTLSFWAKAAAAGSTFKAVMQIGDSYAEQPFTLSENWEEYHWTFTAGANNLELKFQITSLGAFLIDHVSIPTTVQSGEGDIVLVEAESGTPVETSDPPVFLTLQEGDMEFIRVQEDFAATSNPGTTTRAVTYSVTFPAAGTYDLYVKMRVGAGGFSDDSFYYGNGFGMKSVSEDEDWIMVNGLSPVGYDEPDQIVTESGMAGNEVWKWLRLSSFSGQGENGVQFEVPEGELTQTFQIGSRENGLDIEKFAFGTTGVFFTVDNLNKGESGTTVPPPPPFTPTGDPIAQGHPKFLGNVHSNSQIDHFTNYWNQVTPENAGKWSSVEGTRDVMNWTDLDAAYNLAKENGFPFRFHVLVWGNQQPTWIENLPPAEQLEEIEEWFAAVANRYDDIDFIEVVNEPLHDPPAGSGNGNYIEALGGSGETGWDWILNSFRLAKKHFPETELMINEYSITNNATDAQRYLDIVKLLQEEDLIDIIGVQGHSFSTRVPAATTKENLDLLASAGLPIMVTELDIDGNDDQFQLQEYQRIFPVFWEHPAVMGITLWGWKPGMWRTAQGAYLALDNGAERPALVWLREYVESTLPEEPSKGVVKFVLIDAKDDQELFELEDGATINLQDIGTKHLNIRAFTNPEITGSVVFELTGAESHSHIENVEPYALFTNKGDNYKSWTPALGTYQLKATSYSEGKGGGEAGTALTIEFTLIDEIELPSVERVTLYNAVTDEELFDIENGATINLDDIGVEEINIRAYTVPELTGSVRFVLRGKKNHVQIENNEPYALFKNDGNDFYGWMPASGDYNLTVTPYSEAKAKGEAGPAYSISFSIEKDAGENERTLSAYPNPGSRVLSIPVKNPSESINVTITDLSGREVLTKKVAVASGSNFEVDVSQLDIRTYIIKVVSVSEVKTFRWSKK